MTRVTYVRLVAAMLVLTAISSVVLLQFDWFGPAASEQRSEEASPIDTLFDVMIVLSCFVFAIVVVMFTYAIWKFRVRPGDEGDGKPIHGNTKLEIAWTVIPTIIVLFGAGYSWIVLDDIESEASDAIPLHVIGQAFDFGLPFYSCGPNPNAIARQPRCTRETTYAPFLPGIRNHDVWSGLRLVVRKENRR